MLQVNDTIKKQKSKTKLNELSLSSILLSVMIIVVMLLILVAPVRYAESVVSGLKLFFSAVLPGLLPFMFLCKLLTSLGVVEKITKPLNKFSRATLGVNGSGLYAFLMSAISGYPLGARITSDLYSRNIISEDDVTATALLSSVSGPEFVIGAVGGVMLKNAKLGLIIYISNIFSAICVNICINLIKKAKLKKQRNKSNNSPNLSSNLQIIDVKNKKFNLLSVVQETVISLLVVGFYIAIFSLVINLLTDIKIIEILSYPLKFLVGETYSQGLVSGLVEMTNGAKILSTNVTPLSVSIISGLISFSGFSILMQSFSFLSNTPIKKSKFILGKLAQALLSFIFCFVVLSFTL